ncbi:MAG: aminotransferase class IV [Tissierellales bacterium]|jgi:branched-chain amino acid aminotransferase|nr:aminotransferase class IV [Tissierellales bacterium]
MRNENILKYGILNGEVVDSDKIEEVLKTNKVKVYDVLRLVNSKPLYFENHLDRLNRSIELIGYEDRYYENDFKKDIEKLVVKSGRTNNNIKTTYFEEDQPIKVLYMVKSTYPKEDKYSEGYKTILMYEERENPNAKVLNEERRKIVNEILKDVGADEAIFLTENKVVLEGSRSNLFFVKGEKIITSPDERVLLGTTRQKILEICEKNNISVLRREIMLDELNFFDAAFVTGTSIDIMPINRIDTIRFSTNNKVVKKLTGLYNKDKLEYLKNYKRA